jgi:uncharacterized membrane protein
MSENTPRRSTATLFDIRNIIGALLGIYGIVLLLASFSVSAADRQRAAGVNANLWVGIALAAAGALMIAWAVTRPIVVDEEQLERDKHEVQQEAAERRSDSNVG